MYRDGLVMATSGNVSARVTGSAGRQLMAITASSTGYDQMATRDIVVVDFEGEPVLGDAVPSSESLMHGAIYAARPDANAVVHTHSAYASALAVAGLAIPALIDEMVVYVGDSVQVAEYGAPGSQELADQVVAALGERNAVLLRNHGLVGIGHAVTEALNVCQMVERMAQIYIAARAIGRDHPLPADVVATELEVFRMRQQAKSL